MSVTTGSKNAPLGNRQREDILFRKKHTRSRATFGGFAAPVVTQDQSLMGLDAYHSQNQSFLEQANINKEKLAMEEITEQERQKLIATPAHRFAQEEANSQQARNMTPTFVFR